MAKHPVWGSCSVNGTSYFHGLNIYFILKFTLLSISAILYVLVNNLFTILWCMKVVLQFCESSRQLSSELHDLDGKVFRIYY